MQSIVSGHALRHQFVIEKHSGKKCHPPALQVPLHAIYAARFRNRTFYMKGEVSRVTSPCLKGYGKQV